MYACIHAIRTNNMKILNEKDEKFFKEIRVMLNEMHIKWRKEGDGHCKSCEGQIELYLHFPNWFESDDYINDMPDFVSCTVYSYLFGPSRLHEFESLEEAYHEVKQWYKDEMGIDFNYKIKS